MKRYGQHCPVARALDVVGERWNLLVVRELGLGPMRYRDLLDGLPGIPTNLLAARLKDLQAAGVVTKHTLPPPASVTVYQLTEAGHALRPVLSELRAWGRRHAPPPQDTDEIRPGWALLNAAGRPTALTDDQVCELRIGPEHFALSGDDGRLAVRGGAAHGAAATITMPADVLYRLMNGSIDPAAAGQQITVDGDTGIAGTVLASLHNGFA